MPSTKAVNSPSNSTPTNPPPMTTNVRSLRSALGSARRRSLEPLDDVVAEQQGVSQGFERKGMLRAGNHFAVGLGPSASTNSS